MTLTETNGERYIWKSRKSKLRKGGKEKKNMKKKKALKEKLGGQKKKKKKKNITKEEKFTCVSYRISSITEDVAS